MGIPTWRDPLNPSVSVSALMTLRDFTLSNARRFYSSMGNPTDTEGLNLCRFSHQHGNNSVELSIIIIIINRYFKTKFSTNLTNFTADQRGSLTGI